MYEKCYGFRVFWLDVIVLTKLDIKKIRDTIARQQGGNLFWLTQENTTQTSGSLFGFLDCRFHARGSMELILNTIGI